jgi:hypothetical protein
VLISCFSTVFVSLEILQSPIILTMSTLFKVPFQRHYRYYRYSISGNLVLIKKKSEHAFVYQKKAQATRPIITGIALR